MKICTVTFMLNVDESSTISAEGKLDTCGSVSFSYSSHLQQVEDCREYYLEDWGENQTFKRSRSNCTCNRGMKQAWEKGRRFFFRV